VITSNIWRQAKCYTYLCDPDRSLIDTPNLKDSLLSPSHVPNGYCATRQQEFCVVARKYCTYNGWGCNYIIPHTNSSWSNGDGAYNMNIQDSEMIAGAALATIFGIKINPRPTAAQAPCVFYDTICCRPLLDPKIFYPFNFNLTYILEQINLSKDPIPPPVVIRK